MFVYGQHIRGLKPEVPGANAEPLQPDVTYRLFVTAGTAKGQHDFEVKSVELKIKTRLPFSVLRASIFVPAKWHAAK